MLAIDPGPEQSAWVEYRDGRPVAFAIEPNAAVLERVAEVHAERLAVEMIASYGMAVGADVFETAVWSGRFIQCWVSFGALGGGEDTVRRVYRKDVKLHLCGSARAQDKNVRQALIDRFGPGKARAIGLKASQGPLYGVSSHVWSALAVAVTATDLEAGVGAVGAASRGNRDLREAA